MKHVEIKITEHDHGGHKTYSYKLGEQPEVGAYRTHEHAREMALLGLLAQQEITVAFRTGAA